MRKYLIEFNEDTMRVALERNNRDTLPPHARKHDFKICCYKIRYAIDNYKANKKNAPPKPDSFTQSATNLLGLSGSPSSPMSQSPAQKHHEEDNLGWAKEADRFVETTLAELEENGQYSLKELKDAIEHFCEYGLVFGGAYAARNSLPKSAADTLIATSDSLFGMSGQSHDLAPRLREIADEIDPYHPLYIIDDILNHAPACRSSLNRSGMDLNTYYRIVEHFAQTQLKALENQGLVFLDDDSRQRLHEIVKDKETKLSEFKAKTKSDAERAIIDVVIDIFNKNFYDASLPPPPQRPPKRLDDFNHFKRKIEEAINAYKSTTDANPDVSKTADHFFSTTLGAIQYDADIDNAPLLELKKCLSRFIESRESRSEVQVVANMLKYFNLNCKSITGGRLVENHLKPILQKINPLQASYVAEELQRATPVNSHGQEQSFSLFFHDKPLLCLTFESLLVLHEVYYGDTNQQVQFNNALKSCCINKEFTTGLQQAFKRKYPQDKKPDLLEYKAEYVFKNWLQSTTNGYDWLEVHRNEPLKALTVSSLRILHEVFYGNQEIKERFITYLQKQGCDEDFITQLEKHFKAKYNSEQKPQRYDVVQRPFRSASVPVPMERAHSMPAFRKGYQ